MNDCPVCERELPAFDGDMHVYECMARLKESVARAVAKQIRKIIEDYDFEHEVERRELLDAMDKITQGRT